MSAFTAACTLHFGTELLQHCCCCAQGTTAVSRNQIIFLCSVDVSLSCTAQIYHWPGRRTHVARRGVLVLSAYVLSVHLLSHLNVNEQATTKYIPPSIRKRMEEGGGGGSGGGGGGGDRFGGGRYMYIRLYSYIYNHIHAPTYMCIQM